jgi:hypothetical protein
MDITKNYKKDLNWIFKLLKSCETHKHLDVVENCFKFFKLKWQDVILKNESFKIDEFDYKCELKKKRITAKLT